MKIALNMYLRSTGTEIYYSTFCILPKSSCKIFIHNRTDSSLISIIHIHKGILYQSYYINNSHLSTYRSYY